MTTFTRRDAVLIGMTGVVGVHFTSQAMAQDSDGVVTGRTLDHSGEPAKKLRCYLSGTDKTLTSGSYNAGTGEFHFLDIPQGPVLEVGLVYNGEPFTYPNVNPSAKSRLEVRFPLSAREWTPGQKVPKVSAVVTAIGSIASFALKLRYSEETRDTFLADDGYADTISTLEAIQRFASELEFAGDEDRQLVDNLLRNTERLWMTLG